MKKMDHKSESQPPQQKDFSPTGRPEDGRPKNAKDEKKRKQKRVVPRSAASDFTNLFLWANDAQKQIAEIVHPALLSHYEKKNVRSLTKSQMDELEYIKFCLLCGLKPYVELDVTIIQQLLEDSNAANNSVLLQSRRNIVTEFVSSNGRQPTVEEMRNIQSSAYAMRVLSDL